MAACEHETYRATRMQPAEYCENEAVEGEDFCEDHLEDDYADADYWRDLAYDLAREAA